jgi:hypothetical protein
VIFGAAAAAVIFAVLTFAATCAAGWQVALFSRQLHGLIEAASREVELVPVQPLARMPLSVGSPKTA